MKLRSLGKMVLLTIVTLGIYQLFWLYNTKNELVAAGGRVPAFRWLFLPYLGVVLAIGFGVITTVVGGGDSMNGLLWFLLLFLVVMPLTIAEFCVQLWWFYRYCKAAEQVTHGDMSFGASYTLAIVLTLVSFGFIWPFIMQSSFNRVAGTPASGQPVATPAVPAPTPPQAPAPPAASA